MIEKTRMYKHDDTPALNKTGPDQQYVLAVLSHIVTRPAPPPLPPPTKKIVISLAGTSPAEFKKLEVPHTSQGWLSRRREQTCGCDPVIVFAPFSLLAAADSLTSSPPRRALHLEETARARRRSRPGSPRRLNETWKRLPQARQSSVFLFTHTDENIAQRRRSERTKQLGTAVTLPPSASSSSAPCSPVETFGVVTSENKAAAPSSKVLFHH